MTNFRIYNQNQKYIINRRSDRRMKSFCTTVMRVSSNGEIVARIMFNRSNFPRRQNFRLNSKDESTMEKKVVFWKLQKFRWYNLSIMIWSLMIFSMNPTNNFQHEYNYLFKIEANSFIGECMNLQIQDQIQTSEINTSSSCQMHLSISVIPRWGGTSLYPTSSLTLSHRQYVCLICSMHPICRSFALV